VRKSTINCLSEPKNQFLTTFPIQQVNHLQKQQFGYKFKEMYMNLHTERIFKERPRVSEKEQPLEFQTLQQANGKFEREKTPIK